MLSFKKTIDLALLLASWPCAPDLPPGSGLSQSDDMVSHRPTQKQLPCQQSTTRPGWDAPSTFPYSTNTRLHTLSCVEQSMNFSPKTGWSGVTILMHEEHAFESYPRTRISLRYGMAQRHLSGEKTTCFRAVGNTRETSRTSHLDILEFRFWPEKLTSPGRIRYTGADLKLNTEKHVQKGHEI